eukprot:UN0579
MPRGYLGRQPGAPIMPAAVSRELLDLRVHPAICTAKVGVVGGDLRLLLRWQGRDLPARCVAERVHLAVAEDFLVWRLASPSLATEVGASKVVDAVLPTASAIPDMPQGLPEVCLVVDVQVILALRERSLEQGLHSLLLLPGPGDKVEARVALLHLRVDVVGFRQRPVVLLVDVVVLAREHLRPQAHAASEGVPTEHVVRVREDDVEAGQPHELLHHADLQAGHLVEVALPELRVPGVFE